MKLFAYVTTMILMATAASATVTINCYDKKGDSRIKFVVNPSSSYYDLKDVKMYADGVQVSVKHLGPFWDQGPFLAGTVKGKGRYSAQLQLKLFGSWISEESFEINEGEKFILTQVAGVPMDLKCSRFRLWWH